MAHRRNLLIPGPGVGRRRGDYPPPAEVGQEGRALCPAAYREQWLHWDLAIQAQTVVEALGKRRRLWFDYEELQGRLTSLREAAFFDLGVAHGVAEARASRLHGGGQAVEQLAARLVRESLGANVTREDTAAAAVHAAWVELGGKEPAR